MKKTEAMQIVELCKKDGGISIPVLEASNLLRDVYNATGVVLKAKPHHFGYLNIEYKPNIVVKLYDIRKITDRELRNELLVGFKLHVKMLAICDMHLKADNGLEFTSCEIYDIHDCINDGLVLINNSGEKHSVTYNEWFFNFIEINL